MILCCTASWITFYFSSNSPDSNPSDVKSEIDLNGRDGAVFDEPGFVIEVLWLIAAIGTICDDCAYCEGNIKI